MRCRGSGVGGCAALAGREFILGVRQPEGVPPAYTRSYPSSVGTTSLGIVPQHGTQGHVSTLDHPATSPRDPFSSNK